MKSIKKLKRRRNEEKERALYVRLPHVIREEEDVAKLFTGDFIVNLPRQSSRHCYVIFSDIKGKMKNLKAAKNTKIDGKRVIVAPAVIKLEKNTKIKKKKIVIPAIKEDIKITKTLYVSNIKPETKSLEIKAAIPGCASVKMLEPYSKRSKAAKVKMESAQAAAEYLLKMKDRPIVGGRRLRINPDTTVRRRKKKSGPLKIYDGETEIKPEPKQERTLNRNSTALDYISLENTT